MRIDQVNPPADEPVSLDEMKSHLVLKFDDDDTLIRSYIVAARQKCEVMTRRALITQTFDLRIDRFPSPWPDLRHHGHYGHSPEHFLLPGRPAMWIPRPKLQSIASIAYIDMDGVTRTLDPAAYRVIEGTPGELEAAYGSYWPPTRPIAAAVTIRFVAGYGDVIDVPESLKLGIKMLVAHYYMNREAVLVEPGLTPAEVPMGVAALFATEEWGHYP